MEYDKIGKSSKLFFFGIACLVISLGLFFFSMYLLPYLFWELSYDIPDFVLTLIARYQDDYHYSSAGSKTIVWLMFFIPCAIIGFISYFVSNYLDKKVYGIEEPTSEETGRPAEEIKKEIKESAGLGLQILGLMIIIVVVILLLQYLIQSTS